MVRQAHHEGTAAMRRMMARPAAGTRRGSSTLPAFQRLGLPRDREIVRLADHRLAPGMAAAAARPRTNHSTKFMFCGNSLDLRRERLQIHRRGGAFLR